MNFDYRQNFAQSPRLALAILAITLLALTPEGSSATVVAPNQSETLPGEGAQAPFGDNELRYLTIYNASEFLSAMPQGGIITAIAFRLDETVQNAVSVTVPSVEIRMSTSPLTASSISMRFADNVGPDETVVFPRGPMEFQAATSAVVPHPFSEFIPLATPFTYDPRNGSLAVDLWTFQQSQRIFLDAGGGAVAVAGPVTRDRATALLAGPILNVQFLPIPEPRMVAVLALGLIVLFCHRRG